MNVGLRPDSIDTFIPDDTTVHDVFPPSVNVWEGDQLVSLDITDPDVAEQLAMSAWRVRNVLLAAQVHHARRSLA